MHDPAFISFDLSRRVTDGRMDVWMDGFGRVAVCVAVQNEIDNNVVLCVSICHFLLQSLAEMDAQTAALEKEHEAVSTA